MRDAAHPMGISSVCLGVQLHACLCAACLFSRVCTFACVCVGGRGAAGPKCRPSVCVHACLHPPVCSACVRVRNEHPRSNIQP